jgi:hypothetical protein
MDNLITARQAAYDAAVGIYEAYSEAAKKAIKISHECEEVAYDAIGTEDEDYLTGEAVAAENAADTACHYAEHAAAVVAYEKNQLLNGLHSPDNAPIIII